MAYTRRRFLKTATKAGVGAGIGAAVGPMIGQTAVAGRRPNILLLFPDQWRFDWMSTNDGLDIKTPNLDRLRGMGTEFSNAIVAAPVCAPSRACLASGREYDRAMTPSNGYDYPYAKLPTFYTMLRASGYHVLGCGKMDLNKESLWWGIDGKWRLSSLGFSDGINNAGKIDQLISYQLNDNKPADPYLTALERQGLLQAHLADLRMRMKGGYAATTPTPLPDAAYCDNWLGQNGLDLLEAAPKGKPWFLQVNWTGPHNPEDITAGMETTVRGRVMPAVNGSDEYDAETNRRVRQNYTAMCENIDRVVGLYLSKLEAMGELGNTVVVFSSDHGEMLGDHGRWGKSVPYHASACVPFLAAGPGIVHGTMSSALISIMDLAATFLDYAGVAVPKEMDSRSFRAVLEGRADSHREVVFSGLGAWRMAFDGRYKVITGFDPNNKKTNDEWTPKSKEVAGVKPLVFDLQNDAGENKDLFAAMPADAAKLLQRLEANLAS